MSKTHWMRTKTNDNTKKTKTKDEWRFKVDGWFRPFVVRRQKLVSSFLVYAPEPQLVSSGSSSLSEARALLNQRAEQRNHAQKMRAVLLGGGIIRFACLVRKH